MDPIKFEVTTEAPEVTSMDFGQDRLDCEHLDDITEKWTVPNAPSFVTVLMRFFGNIFVDCFRSIFE